MPGLVRNVLKALAAIHLTPVGTGMPCWRPAAATENRARFDLDAAQAVLGHARADVTQVYAERDLARARAVITEIG
jgi:integrase